jgi:hypothetical protein
MANTFTADFVDVWSKEQQMVFYKTNVARKIADTSPISQLKSGDVFNKPYRGALSAQIITRGNDMTIDALTDTIEYLSVDKQFGIAYEIHEFDDIQSAYDLAMNYGKDSGETLSNMVDSYVLAEALNATSTVTGGTLATTNLIGSLSGVKKALKKLNVTSNNLYGVISPEFEDVVTQYVEARETVLGDKVGENGYIGMYMGIKFHVSNQLTSTAVLSLATQPTANDTVTIAGQVFTFVSSIGTTAGNVLIGANVDATRASFATLLNAPGTTTSTGVALTGTALRTFQNTITAVNSASADTLTVTARGIGVLDVSETLTDATDTWTAASQLQHNLFGVIGNPTLVIQREPKIVEVQKQLQLGKNYLNGVLFGVKTFVENAKQMVDLTIRCDTYNA